MNYLLFDKSLSKNRRLYCGQAPRWAASVLVFALLCTTTGCARVEDSLFSSMRDFARSSAGLEVKSVSAGGIRTVYAERPGPGETIVMVHGFAANKDNWLKFIPEIPREYRILAIDLPGHGDSVYDPDFEHSPGALTQHLSTTLNALRVKRFHLIGNSLGGLIVTQFAHRFPDRVLSLGLLDPAGVYPPNPSELQQLLDNNENPLLVKTSAGFDRLIDFVFHEKPFMPWPARPALARIMVNRRDINQKIWDDMYDNLEEVTTILPELSMPLLLIWGDKDRVLDVSSVKVYRQLQPAIKAVVLTDCGHSPMMERPEETAAIVVSFIQRSDSPARAGSVSSTATR